MSELAEPCRDCRAPLVPGQRYCLYCGARRPDARLEFMDVLVEDVARPASAPVVAVAPPAGARDPGVNGWLRQNSPLLALTGLVLGTLLIGLLIGHWATTGDASPAPARAAAPQVIRVEAGTAGPATTTAADTATDAAAAGDGAGDKKAKAKTDKKAAKADAQAPAPAPADAVSADSLGSGEAKQKAIEKAAKSGKPISTGDGGKLPPTDDKAPAGGTEFETIG